MFRQQRLLEDLNREKNRTENLIKKMERRQEQLPHGSLIYRNGSYYRDVYHDGKYRQIIIPAGLPDRTLLIQQLQERRYIKKALPMLKKNLNCYKNLLKRLHLYDPVELKSKLPLCYSDMDLKGFLLSEDIDPQIWEGEAYEKNMGYFKNLKYKSDGGILTRSKAEAEIATKLEQRDLVFRYDPILHLGKHVLSPDFEILQPIHRRLIYWEHFGKMGDEKYAVRSMDKIRIYGEHGICSGDNLIITWETKEFPLTFEHINERIDRYLLGHNVRKS